MFDNLTLAPLDVGAGALVVVVVLMIFTGRLVTRSQHADVQAQRDKWQGQAEEWREAHATSEKHRAMAIDQLSDATAAIQKIADAKELSVAMLQAIRAEAAGTEEDS